MEDKEYQESVQIWEDLTQHQINTLDADIKNIEKEVKIKKDLLNNLQKQLESSKNTQH